MTKARLQRRVAEARLIRIDLPRVQIEHARHAFGIDAAQTPANERIGEQTEVPTASTRQASAAYVDGRQRHFEQAPRSNAVGAAGRIAHTVEVVSDRKDAGVVFEPEIREDVERPSRSGRDGVARRAVTPDRGADEILQQALGAICLGSKHLWRSEEHTSELQSRENLVCRLLLEKKKKFFA